VLECKYIAGPALNAAPEQYPLRARTQPDGSEYNKAAYLAIAKALHDDNRFELENNPGHLHLPASEEPEERFEPDLAFPCPAGTVLYARFYCDELLRQAYYPKTRPLIYNLKHYAQLLEKDTKIFSLHNWTHHPKFYGLDTVQ